ncbi:MAG: hypothetical protein JWO11_2510 [Nocardioides sp.]|nr:hypothetical protein [Nocardioides sp.]
MRVVADLGLCQGHQMCQGEAPDVFGWDDDADSVVVLVEDPDESLRPQVTAAVRYCPAMALAIEEDRRGAMVSTSSTNEAKCTRAQMNAFWERWLEVNRLAEREQDWSHLAAFYAEDATYGWMYTPDEHFMAVGRDQIRDWALRNEMAGMEGWHYDYVSTVMDDSNGMVIGFWKQKAGLTDDATGQEYEVQGIGGSWFGLAPTGPDGALEIAWQRDWFDLGSTAHTYLQIMGSGKAPQGLVDRMHQNSKEQPGHFRPEDLPSTVWPPPVEAGTYLQQEAVVSTGSTDGGPA